MRSDGEVPLLEGLPLNVAFRTQGRTIGEGDFSALTNLTWTTGELHTNRELMTSARGREILGDGPTERVLALPAVAAVIVGLAAKHWVSYYLPWHFGVRVRRSLSLEVTAGAPLMPGDTLWADCLIVAARASPDEPGCGLMDVQERAFNQRQDQVAVVTQHFLFERRVPPYPIDPERTQDNR
jgi:hypothetical protein